MRPSLQLNIKQNLSISPKLQQAIRLLQLSGAELDAEITAALDSNPLLEIDTLWEEAPANASHTDASEYANFYNPPPSLQDYLFWQLNLTTFTDRDHIIAITIIDAIDEDGYLRNSAEEILMSLMQNYPQQFAELELAEVIAVLHRVQQFDPPGIAARDLKECMLLQIMNMDLAETVRDLCKRLISDHLELLGVKNYSQIKKELHIDDQELNTLLHIVRNLRPKPGRVISNNDTEYLVPDVIVEKNNDRWQISLNTNVTQHLRINHNYALLLRTATTESACSALRKQYLEAQWLLDSIKNRNLTLLKVASYIVCYQSEFLSQGEAKMRPLTLQVIAQELNLSESTISRITTKKYIYTPRGIFELKYFFSQQISSTNGNVCSATAVKAIIKNLIDEEPTDHPLSDQQIAVLLTNKGVNIARRTVTKYREALGIQASNLRGI